jgi:hypothetical protein
MANLTFKASLIPSTTDTYSLGDSNKKWKIYGSDLDLSGTLTVVGNTTLSN